MQHHNTLVCVKTLCAKLRARYILVGRASPFLTGDTTLFTYAMATIAVREEDERGFLQPQQRILSRTRYERRCSSLCLVR